MAAEPLGADPPAVAIAFDAIERLEVGERDVRERTHVVGARGAPVVPEPDHPRARGRDHRLVHRREGLDPRVSLGHGARVIRQSRGIFDTAPLSLLTTQTVQALSAMTGAALEPLRFRPNLLVEAAGS